MSKVYWKALLVVSLLGQLTAYYVYSKYESYKGSRDYFPIRYDSLLQDFGGRQFYAAEDTQLFVPSNDSVRIVLIGSEFAINWHLDRRLPGYQVINRAIDEQRVAGMLCRFRQDVVDLKPDIVLIGVSAYNFRPWSSVAEILDYVADMTDLARVNDIQPILVNTTPPTEVCWIEEHSNWIVKDSLALFNDQLEQYAQIEHIPCLDFHALVSDELGFLKADYAANQTDLNERGYTLVTDKLKKLLDQKTGEQVKR